MRQTLVLNILVLSFFVYLFFSIYRRRPSSRLRLWIAAWCSIIVHFLILLFNPASDRLSRLVFSLSIDAIMVAATLFILSSAWIYTPVPRRVLGLALVLPGLVFSACVAFGLRSTGLLLGSDLLAQGAALVFLWRYSRGILSLTVPGTVLILACAQWSVVELFARRTDSALSILLMELFAAYALLLIHDLRRRSPGALTTFGGVLAWAAVFPAGMLVQHFLPKLAINPEMWNVPKVVVAFGMLVILFEDELTQAEREREQYRHLFDGNPLPMWIFDPESTQLLEANHAAVRDFGWTRAELPQLTVADLAAESEHSPVGLIELNWRLAGASLRQPEIASPPAPNEAESEAAPPPADQVRAQSMRFRTRKGDELFVEVTLQKVGFHGQEARLLMVKDITAQMQAQEQLIHQANHDPLTGLPNRLLLNDRMRTALATAKRHGAKAAIVCLDLDRFKHINDTYGHAAGDSCLQEIAERLRQRLRAVDTAARTGGEEFVVILDNIGSLFDAERVANDLLFALSAPHFFEGHNIHLTASIGISLFPDDGEDAAGLWSLADAAMYLAKQDGGNRHTFVSRSH